MKGSYPTVWKKGRGGRPLLPPLPIGCNLGPGQIINDMLRVSGLRLRMWWYHISEWDSAGFRVQGSGFRVLGSGFWVQGSGFRVQGQHLFQKDLILIKLLDLLVFVVHLGLPIHRDLVGP